MNAARNDGNLFDNVDPKRDVLFFKAGSRGLVSFHGRNYNVKKRMSADEKQKLVQEGSFVKVSSHVYVNVRKVTAIVNDQLVFGDLAAGSKRVHASKKMQHAIARLINR